MESNITINEYNSIKLLNQTVINVIGYYLLIVMATSITFNLLFLFLFVHNVELRNVFNKVTMVISIMNLIGTASLPLSIHSIFKQEWTSTKNGCILSGFIIYFSACTNVYLMALISVERYILIKEPSRINQKVLKRGILACICLGLFWSLMPVIGWSHYSFEPVSIGCCVELRDRSANVISYNIAMFIFVFIIPFSLIFITNLKSILIVRLLREKSINQSVDYKAENLKAAEKRMTIILVIYIAGFMLTWTPYAFISLYSAFVNPNHITPLMSTIPAVFAKTSMALSILFYIFTNKELKLKLRNELVFSFKSTQIHRNQ